MRLPRWGVLVTILLLAIAPMVLPGTGLAGDDNDNKNDTKKKDKQESSRQTNDTPTTAKPESSPQTIVPADPKPDLVLTYGGFSSPTNLQLIKFTVKNVGTAPSSATTKVRVVTSTPEPTPWFRELDLPSLKPGESKEVLYPLAADCNGHVVKALVNDPSDVNAANNVVEQTVCSGAPVPTSPGGPVSDRVTSPTNTRSVDHGATDAVTDQVTDRSVDHGPFTLTFAPVASRTLTALKHEGNCFSNRDIINEVHTPPFPLMAGFKNGSVEQPITDCQNNGIWQAAFRFDLAEIRGQWAAGQVSVLNMELTFKETPFGLTFDIPGYWSPPGPIALEPTQTCWPRLARPTVDWSNTTDLVTNEWVTGALEIGRFSLADQTGKMLPFPDNDKLGFLILGHNEDMHFNDAACVSKIEDVRLTVTYATR